jgi:phage shock protein E
LATEKEPPMRVALAFLALSLSAPALAQSGEANIDYQGFETLTGQVADYRSRRLLSWDEFARKATEPGVLLLDARSADAYAAGHIRGAVNLPFTDFTPESLAAVIGGKERPILIYCNNNFVNDLAPVRMKLRPLALNIQTFINLVGYGYRNVYELRSAIDFNDPKVGWVKGPAAVRREQIRAAMMR